METDKPYQHSERSPLIAKQCMTCGTLRLLEDEPAECPTCTKFGKSTTDVQDIIVLPTSHDVPQDIKIAIAGRFLA